MTTYERTQAGDSHMAPAPIGAADAGHLRRAVMLLLAGQVLYILVTQFHAGGDANDHEAIFATYAADDIWKVVHFGQFLAMCVLVAGLLVLYAAVRGAGDRAAWLARLGAAAGVVALSLYAALQALDGVGNKELDQAWVSAPEGEKTARFASAEAVRWLEWGVRSYHDYALGFALLLFAAALMAARGMPRAIGSLMGVSGAVYLVQGWVVGAEGFSSTHTTLILLAWMLSLAWMIWLLVESRRRTV